VVIDYDGPVPLWRQVAGIIRARIDSGEYPPGRAIPSIVKLTAEFGVAQMTVLKAIRSLKDEGLLTGTPGRGTYVTGQRK
jgi:GntR family transcriptional regulator